MARVHERIRNQRRDFCHKQSRKIIEQYQYICVEDLNIKNRVEGSHFAKSITDASWNQFRQFITYKAAEAGRKLGRLAEQRKIEIESGLEELFKEIRMPDPLCSNDPDRTLEACELLANDVLRVFKWVSTVARDLERKLECEQRK